MKKQENERLKLQLEDTRLQNELLSTHQPDSMLEENGDCHTGVDVCDGRIGTEEKEKMLSQSGDCATDAMELPRLKRRLQQMENEVRRTKTKLLNIQATMKVRQGVK